MRIEALQRRRLRAGTRVSFTIVADGRPSQTLTLRIRKGRKPLTR
jgi:cold shock CspA family protein